MQNVTPSLDFQFRLGQKKDFNGGKKGEKEQKTQRDRHYIMCADKMERDKIIIQGNMDAVASSVALNP